VPIYNTVKCRVEHRGLNSLLIWTAAEYWHTSYKRWTRHCSNIYGIVQPAEKLEASTERKSNAREEWTWKWSTGSKIAQSNTTDFNSASLIGYATSHCICSIKCQTTECRPKSYVNIMTI